MCQIVSQLHCYVCFGLRLLNAIGKCSMLSYYLIHLSRSCHAASAYYGPSKNQRKHSETQKHPGELPKQGLNWFNSPSTIFGYLSNNKRNSIDSKSRLQIFLLDRFVDMSVDLITKAWKWSGNGTGY